MASTKPRLPLPSGLMQPLINIWGLIQSLTGHCEKPSTLRQFYLFNARTWIHKVTDHTMTITEKQIEKSYT